MSVDAHRAFSSSDCAVPNCPEEAEGTGAYCPYHREQRTAMLGLPLTRDDEHRPQEPKKREETPVETCKACGGELDEMGRTTTSPRHKGRCATCRSEGQKKATSHLRKGAPPKPEPEPKALAEPLSRLASALERYTDARADLLRETEELGEALTEAERYLDEGGRRA